MNSCFLSKRWEVLLLLGVVAVFAVTLVEAWTGTSAHSLVLLRDLRPDTPLWHTFYDSPPGTTLTVESGGYTDAGSGARAPLLEHRVGADAFTGGLRSRLPLSAALSDEWVLLEPPRRNHSQPALLHCRLPLQKSAAAVRRAKAAYVRAHEPLMRERLRQWWGRRAKRQPILYGSGASFDNVTHFYMLAPRRGAWRVRDTLLRRRLRGGDAADAVKRMFSRVAAQPALDPETVYPELLQRIGTFHEEGSAPRWNARHHVWEIRMGPAGTAPCTSHYADVGASRESRQVTQRRWQTTVRLRCPPASREDADMWTFQPDRQRCTQYVELFAPDVCVWEYEWDSLAVNPIPCALLD